MTENLPVFKTLQWVYHWCIRVNWWGAIEPRVLGKERGLSGWASNWIKSSDVGVWTGEGGGLFMVVFSHFEWSTLIYWDKVHSYGWQTQKITYCTYKIIWGSATFSRQLQVFVCTQWHGCVSYYFNISSEMSFLNGRLLEITLEKVYQGPLVEFLATNEQVPFTFSISHFANLQWMVYIWSHHTSDCEEAVIM